MRSLKSSLFLALLLAPVPLFADWPNWRGPTYDGVAVEKGVLPKDVVGLRVAWKKSLGTGYSSVAIASGKAVTFFGDGTNDYVVALDLASGRELWRYRADLTYKGGLAGSGSADGASGTPSIEGGVVYALAPMGQLLALDLATGKLLWSRRVDQEDAAKPPGAGFVTSPTIAGGVVVVQTGGAAGHGLTGYDKLTGARLWSRGDDPVGYQSPILATIDGKRQLVALSQRELAGLDPQTGTVFWQQVFERKGEDGAMSHAIPAGADTILLNTRNLGTSLLRIVKAGTTHKVEEAWKTAAFNNTYGLPVIYDGHIYGYSGRFLTCVSLATGKEVWKSRPPGGRNLILVDGHLFTVSTEGEMVVVRATPEGYQEKARLKVLDDTSEASPAFADGRLLIRNLNEIAAISLTASPTVARALSSVSGVAVASAFGGFIRSVEAAPEAERTVMVDAFLKEQKSFPIVEGDRLVHFVYRGTARDVALNGSMTDVYPGDASEPLARVAGTDFFHRTFELVPRSRWDYRFIVDFKPFTLDPMNPRHVPERRGRGEVNEVVLPGYPAPAFIEPPAAGRSRGAIEEITLTSAVLGTERKIKVYLPHGYGVGTQRYPVLVVANGYQALELMKLDNAFDNLIGQSVAPFIAVMPEFKGIPEEAGEATPRMARMIAEELIPLIDAKYRTLARPDARAIMGSFRGATAPFLMVALKTPVFSKVALQSLYLIPPYDGQTLAALRANKPPIEFYLDWNTYEMNSKELAVDLREHGARFAKLLDELGYKWTGGEAADASGWASWRARTDRILRAFFPLKR